MYKVTVYPAADHSPRVSDICEHGICARKSEQSVAFLKASKLGLSAVKAFSFLYFQMKRNGVLEIKEL